MHPSACEGIMWSKITGPSGTMIGQLNNYDIQNDENTVHSIYCAIGCQSLAPYHRLCVRRSIYLQLIHIVKTSLK